MSRSTLPLRVVFTFLSLILAACGTPRPQPDAAAEPVPALPPADGILRAGLESPYLLDSGDGTAWLGVLITPPLEGGARPPLALALVVDTSGSMEGDKIEHARFAARSLIEALAPGDQVAVVEFASEVKVLSPRIVVGQSDLAALLARIDALQATSSTALHGGVVAGLQALEGAGGAVRRLLLISDGMANVGPSKPEEILAALPVMEAPVAFSALGVGTDYDEAVLGALAGRGGGSYYHLTDPVQLAGILQTELGRARAVGGREAVLTLVPKPGVEILAGGPGLVLQRGTDGSVAIAVGDVYGGETRSVTVQVRVPVQAGGGGGALAAVRLRYVTLSGTPVEREVAVHYQLTPSAEVVTQSEVPAYMVAADRTRVAHVLSDAAALIKEGDVLEAQALLKDERSRLESRRERLAGGEKAEVETLIQLFRDPYVDADLGTSGPGGPSAAPRVDTFPTLVESLRQGHPVSESQLNGLDKDRLRILRNVAYARHGYRFNSADLRDFFKKASWYREDASFRPARLTTDDVRNVATLKTWEQRAGLVAVAAAPRGPAVTTADFQNLVDRVRRGEIVPPALLDGLNLTQLRLLRNVAYARHGYVFRAADLRLWFAAHAWYRPDPAFQASDLGPEDGANVRQIKEREARAFHADPGALREFELRNRARAHQVVH